MPGKNITMSKLVMNNEELESKTTMVNDKKECVEGGGGREGEERGRKLIFHSWNALRAGVSSNNARNATNGRTLKITS